MTGSMIIEALVAALIVLGGAFALIGSWGLVRLPTIMERLHGPTKATTLGLGALLVASVLFFQLVRGSWTVHELLITLFLFITAPISANMVAKVHLHQAHARLDGESHGPAGAPPTPTSGDHWSTVGGDGHIPDGNGLDRSSGSRQSAPPDDSAGP